MHPKTLHQQASQSTPVSFPVCWSWWGGVYGSWCGLLNLSGREEMGNNPKQIDQGMLIINNGEELPLVGVSSYANNTIVVIKQGDHNVTLSLLALDTLLSHFKNLTEGDLK
jgi:hypothetical protein